MKKNKWKKKALIVWCCGLGKTLLSVFLSKRIKASRILVGVPSLQLMDQYKKECKKIYGSSYKYIINNGNIKINIT